MKIQLAIIFTLFTNIFSHPVNNNIPSQSVFDKFYFYTYSILEKRKTQNRKGSSDRLQLVKRRRRGTQPEDNPVHTEVEVENENDKSRNRERNRERNRSKKHEDENPSSYPTSYPTLV